jgi:hypothetical protein
MNAFADASADSFADVINSANLGKGRFFLDFTYKAQWGLGLGLGIELGLGLGSHD